MRWPRHFFTSTACPLLVVLLCNSSLIDAVAYGQTNLAPGKAVADGSGAWTGGGGLSQSPNHLLGQFNGTHINDGQLNDTASNPATYWLGRQGINNEYLTVDLGSALTFSRIDLQNTHNGGSNDRGARFFNIQVGNTALSGPFTPLVTGSLADVRNRGTNIPIIRYDVPETTARYVRFEAETDNAAQNGSGLSEIQIYDTRGPDPTNAAAGRPVIDGSAAWNNRAFDTGNVAPGHQNFTAQLVTDGSTSDTFGVNYWLGRNGAVNETFTVDLGRVHDVSEIRLRNSSNGGDSATNAFEVRASNYVDGNKQLVRPTTVLDSTLSNGVAQAAQAFNSGNGLTTGDYRYLQFVGKSFHAGDVRVGLNEFEVTGTPVAEPTAPEAINVALGRSIVAGSGAFSGTYPESRVTDGASRDYLLDASSYWLGSNGDPTEFFTLDLGEVRDVNTIALRNTHNQASNDRGTRDFQLFGSTDNVSFTPILEGKLTTAVGGNSDPSIPLDVFTSSNGLEPGSYRYLRFNTLSSSFNGNHVGLNEIQVYEENLSANVAAGKPIVAGSGSYQFNTDPNAGVFAASNVTDQRIDDLDVGVAGNPNTSFWLGRDGFANEFFTIDLGGPFLIDRIDLQNTHNRAFVDRGTQDFMIEASFDGISFTEILSDTLINPLSSGNDMPIESFASRFGDFDPFQSRFIRFTAINFYGGAGSGLNEIFIFGVLTPEPTAFALGCAALLCCLGMAGRRRRRRSRQV